MNPTFTRILVPTDFSAMSDAALEYARALAKRFGASLHLLHVIEDPLAYGGFSGEMYLEEPSPTLRATLVEEAEKKLGARLRPEDRRRLHATTEVTFGAGPKTITDFASSRGIDLIVMGTHGRTGLAHAVMGSVAERVVRTAPCPVLTIRVDKRSEALPVVDTASEVPARETGANHG
jgi:nucleotide-binding universal stress UspA family protein